MQIGQIFFSYSRVDGKFALKLGEDLRKAGVDIWIDQIDIRPSEPWDEEIEKALQESGCLLIILSDTSVASDNVLNEINYALETKKKILPILLEKDIKKPFNISRLQHIDFTGSYENGLNTLLKSLSLENSLPIKSKGAKRIAIRTSIIVATIVVAITLLIIYLFNTGISKPFSFNKKNKNTLSAIEDSSFNVNGKWSTYELVNPFDQHDKYKIYFELETHEHTVVGSINIRSTVDWKGYNFKKDFFEGKINKNHLSFYTVEQSFDGDRTVDFKNFYYGTVLKNEIQFTLKSDRPMGFPGQKFVALRSQP
ncbi:MAG: toll/interleukin-1 receptor domain-containing protein [Chitinophagaceae bacterium]